MFTGLELQVQDCQPHEQKIDNCHGFSQQQDCRTVMNLFSCFRWVKYAQFYVKHLSYLVCIQIYPTIHISNMFALTQRVNHKWAWNHYNFISQVFFSQHISNGKINLIIMNTFTFCHWFCVNYCNHIILNCKW